MSDTKLIGQNYSTPDLVAKVTGTAKYAEDYRAEGMLFVKLLLSPDARAALAMSSRSATTGRTTHRETAARSGRSRRSPTSRWPCVFAASPC